MQVTAETVTLSATHDATLFEQDQGTLADGSGQYLFVGRTGGPATRRALLTFDVTTPHTLRCDHHLCDTHIEPVTDDLDGTHCSTNCGATGERDPPTLAARKARAPRRQLVMRPGCTRFTTHIPGRLSVVISRLMPAPVARSALPARTRGVLPAWSPMCRPGSRHPRRTSAG